MRTARLVGLSHDGRSLIVATDSGEELAISADDRLRAALRGDRPRLAQLEFEMETALSPRDIQTRIRSGATLEEVARVAGIPMDRVERFAAPVLAERDHIATMAMSSSVRRRGETSGHRNLRITVTERLVGRGVDIDTIDWDSYRLEDGRWTVTADYRSGESTRHAAFLFDLQGRFSIADNDEARWLLGEHSPAKGPQPGRRRPEHGAGGLGDDTEPTLDLSDELALVRATQETPPPETAELDEASEPTIAVVRPLQVVADLEPEPEAADEPQLQAETLPEVEPDREPDGEPEEESALETLYGMLGGDGYAEDSIRVYAGLSDASAVPETEGGGWEPAIVVNYPVEPSLLDELDIDGDPDAPHELPGTDEPGPPDRLVNFSDRIEEAEEFIVESHEAHAAPPVSPPEPEPEADTSEDMPPAAAPKSAKRKRASVPSWDEIMFGGPRPSS